MAVVNFGQKPNSHNIVTVRALNQSLAINSSASSDWYMSEIYDQARVAILVAGADVSVKLEGAPKDASSAYLVKGYAAGATGAQALENIADKFVRITATNGSSLSAQSVDVWLVLRPRLR